jgi:cytochrome c553
MADEWEDRVDVVARGLLGLTVACARCHDHKFDPIPTEDYYALAGVFASTEMFNKPLDEKQRKEEKNGQAKKPREDAMHIVREGEAAGSERLHPRQRQE